MYFSIRAKSFIAGREEVKYPDFTLTKPLPRQPPTPRIHCHIGVIEIKTFSRPEERDVEKGNLPVDDALEQAVEYASRLFDSPFSLREQNSLFIATYVVYGKYYTRITVTTRYLYGFIEQRLGSLYLRTLHSLRAVHRFCIDYVSLLSVTGTTVDRVWTLKPV